MSATSAARAHTRRPVARRRTRPPHLRVVRPRPDRPARLPFGLVIVALLSAGFVALLGLNTASAQNAFHQHRLQLRADLLADREQALEIALAQRASPQVLAATAHRLGMRPAAQPRFLRIPSAPRVATLAPATVPTRCDGARRAGSLCPGPAAR